MFLLSVLSICEYLQLDTPVNMFSQNKILAKDIMNIINKINNNIKSAFLPDTLLYVNLL